MKLVCVCACVRVCERVCVCVCMQLKRPGSDRFSTPPTYTTNAALRLQVSCAMAPQLDTKSEADATTTSLDTAAKAAFASGRHEEAAALFGQLLLTGAPEPHLVLCNRSAAWAKLGKWAEAEGDARLAMVSSPPSFVKAPYRLACALQGCGRLDEVRSWGSGQASAAPVSHGPFLSCSSAP